MNDTRAPSPLSLAIASLLRHRIALVAIPLGVAIVSAAILLMIPNRYAASVGLVPESRSASPGGQLASLAALAGVSVTGTPTTQSPQFYAAMLRSRPILHAVLERHFPASSWRVEGHDSLTLAEILVPDEAEPARRLWLAADRLAEVTDVNADIRTGIVRLTVTLPYREGVAQVAAAFADELERFNREKRQTQARARRVFIAQRVTEAEASLREAEEAMRRFLLNNREYRNSPTLMYEYQRLERVLVVQQELYMELRRQLDAARIAEVDDLPAITQVERPLMPERKSWPRRTYWLLSIVLMTTMLTAAWAILADHHGVLMPGVAHSLGPLRARLGGWWRRRAPS